MKTANNKEKRDYFTTIQAYNWLILVVGICIIAFYALDKEENTALFKILGVPMIIASILLIILTIHYFIRANKTRPVPNVFWISTGISSTCVLWGIYHTTIWIYGK